MKIDVKRLDTINFKQEFKPKPTGWDWKLKGTLISIKEAAEELEPGRRTAIINGISQKFSTLLQFETSLKIIEVAHKSGVFSRDPHITIEDIFLRRLQERKASGPMIEYLYKIEQQGDEDLSSQQFAAACCGFDRLALAIREKAYGRERLSLLILFAGMLNRGRFDVADRFFTEHQEEIKREIAIARAAKGEAEADAEDYEGEESFLSGYFRSFLPVACAIASGKTEYFDRLRALGYNPAWELPACLDSLDSSWPLLAAVRGGNVSLVKELLSIGVESSVECTYDENQTEIVSEYLYDCYSNKISKLKPEIIALLYSETQRDKQEIPITTVLSAALSHADYEAADAIFEAHQDLIKKEVEDAAKTAQEHGASFRADGLYFIEDFGEFNPLALAIHAKKPKIANFLLDCGYSPLWEGPDATMINAADWPLLAATLAGDVAMIDKLLGLGVSVLETKPNQRDLDVIEQYLLYTQDEASINSDVLSRLYDTDGVKNRRECGYYSAFSMVNKLPLGLKFFVEKGERVSDNFSFLNNAKTILTNIEMLSRNYPIVEPYLFPEDYTFFLAIILKIGLVSETNYAEFLSLILAKSTVYEKGADGLCKLAWRAEDNVKERSIKAAKLTGSAAAVLQKLDDTLATFGSLDKLKAILECMPLAAGRRVKKPEYIHFIGTFEKRLQYLAGCFGVYEIGTILHEWKKMWGSELPFVLLEPIDESKLWPPIAGAAQEAALPAPRDMYEPIREAVNTFFDNAELSEEQKKGCGVGLSKISEVIKGRKAIVGMPNSAENPEEFEKWHDEFALDLYRVCQAAKDDRDRQGSLVRELGRAGHNCAAAWRESVDHFHSLWVEPRGQDVQSCMYDAIKTQVEGSVEEIARNIGQQVEEGNHVHLPNAVAKAFAERHGFSPKRRTHGDPVVRLMPSYGLTDRLNRYWNRDVLKSVIRKFDEQLKSEGVVQLRDWLLDNVPDSFRIDSLEETKREFAFYFDGNNVVDGLIEKEVFVRRGESPKDALARTHLAQALLKDEDHPLWKTLSVETGYCYREGFTQTPYETFEEAVARKEGELSEDRSKKRRVDSEEIHSLKKKYINDVLAGRAQWTKPMQEEANKLLLSSKALVDFGRILSLPNIENELVGASLYRQDSRDTLEKLFGRERKEGYGAFLINEESGLINDAGIYAVLVKEGMLSLINRKKPSLPLHDATHDADDAQFLDTILEKVAGAECNILVESIQTYASQKAGSAPMEHDPTTEVAAAAFAAAGGP